MTRDECIWQMWHAGEMADAERLLDAYVAAAVKSAVESERLRCAEVVAEWAPVAGFMGAIARIRQGGSR